MSNRRQKMNHFGELPHDETGLQKVRQEIRDLDQGLKQNRWRALEYKIEIERLQLQEQKLNQEHGHLRRQKQRLERDVALADLLIRYRSMYAVTDAVELEYLLLRDTICQTLHCQEAKIQECLLYGVYYAGRMQYQLCSTLSPVSPACRPPATSRPITDFMGRIPQFQVARRLEVFFYRQVKSVRYETAYNVYDIHLNPTAILEESDVEDDDQDADTVVDCESSQGNEEADTDTDTEIDNDDDNNDDNNEQQVYHDGGHDNEDQDENSDSIIEDDEYDPLNPFPEPTSPIASHLFHTFVDNANDDLELEKELGLRAQETEVCESLFTDLGMEEPDLDVDVDNDNC